MLYSGKGKYADLLVDGEVLDVARTRGVVVIGQQHVRREQDVAAVEDPVLPQASLTDGVAQGLGEPEHLRSHSRHSTSSRSKLVEKTLEKVSGL